MNWFTERRTANKAFNQTQYDIACKHVFIRAMMSADVWGSDKDPLYYPFKGSTDQSVSIDHKVAYQNAMRRGYRQRFVNEQFQKIREKKERDEKIHI